MTSRWGGWVDIGHLGLEFGRERSGQERDWEHQRSDGH